MEGNEHIESQIEKMAKKIKGAFCLRGNVMVSFPTNHPETKTRMDKQLNKISMVMSKAFGGTTEWEGWGCWVEEGKNEPICEPVRIFYSAHDCFKDSKAPQEFFKTLKEVGLEGKQKALFVNAEGTSYIFSPEAEIEE
jgi:hypothetical protein